MVGLFRKFIVLSFVIILFYSCSGYDLSNRTLAIRDSVFTLYIADSSGSNRITLAKNVHNFRWLSDSKEIEMVMTSLDQDTVKSKFSFYRVPITDAMKFYRISGAYGEDTVKAKGEIRLFLR